MVECPLCGQGFWPRKHPKDSSTVEALPQLLAHINSTHQREVAERLAREK